jgi:hypothetical protein
MYVAKVEEDRSVIKILIGKQAGRDLYEGLYGTKILELTLKKWMSVRGIGLFLLRIRIIREPL